MIVVNVERRNATVGIWRLALRSEETCMNHGKIKTEMKGTGGGRWTTRAVAKRVSKKKRRTIDKKTSKEQH